MESVEVTLSEWLWHALEAYEVLTIDSAYFRLSKPMERRLYEIARKHVGQQGWWEIRLDTLWKKTGSLSELKKFKHQLKQIIVDDLIPQYRTLLQDNDMVVFYDRKQEQVAKAIMANLPKTMDKPAKTPQT
jgi:plasmid replication initiation protein